MTDTTNALAPRDLLILTALAEQPTHGYGLIKQVEARSAEGSGPVLRLDPANLYRVLRRMQRSGWIDDATFDGRRKVYAISDLGRNVLREEVERLECLLQQARPVLAGRSE